MAPAAPARTDGDLRRRAWRWHFLAAFLVVPFVLWQSVTGTIYLWSDAWVDVRHPELRFVAPAPGRVPLDAQVAAARMAHPTQRLGTILVPADPTRATQLNFGDGAAAAAAFVDPYRGTWLGSLSGSAWPGGWSRRLHGGWPLGDAGSWLLELGASWTIVMVLTGVYLWWPRDGRGVRGTLLPRLGQGARVLWRDLHACVAVWISALLVLFLLTALPWTSFWGGSVLQPAMRALAQQTPAAAGFAPVFAGDAPARAAAPASLQSLLDRARSEGLSGDVMLYLVDGPPGAAVSVRDLHARASQQTYVLLDRGTADVVARAGWDDFPLMARAVATGVDIHEASFFGRLGPWVNTAFAAVLVWLSVTGTMAWWRRRPAHALGVPPPPRRSWPMPVRVAAVLLFALLPLLALSAALLWLLEHGWRALASRRDH